MKSMVGTVSAGAGLLAFIFGFNTGSTAIAATGFVVMAIGIFMSWFVRKR